MKVLYISGKYTDPRGAWYIHQNIEKAKEVAKRFWIKGFAVICPHANTAFMDCSTMTWEKWIAGDIAILERCDAIAMLDGYKESKGALAELQAAKEKGIEIFEISSCGTCWRRLSSYEWEVI